MHKKKGVLIGIIISFLIILSFYLDKLVVGFIGFIRTDTLQRLFLFITSLENEIIIFILLTGIFLLIKHKRRWILPLWVTLISSAVISFLLKIIIQRPRPFQVGISSILSFLEKDSFYLWNYSFPSFQTMFFFSALPLIHKEFPKLGYI